MSNTEKIVEAFTQAAHETLQAELQIPVEYGAAIRINGHAQPLTALVGLVGDLEGMVGVSAREDTACSVVGHLLGEEIPAVTPLVESAIGEMCNVIAGRAALLLQVIGYQVDLSPPRIVAGETMRLRVGDLERMAIPFSCELGDLELSFAARVRRCWYFRAAPGSTNVLPSLAAGLWGQRGLTPSIALSAGGAHRGKTGGQ